MKENDSYYALNYSNDPFIQRWNFWQPLPLGTQPKLRSKKKTALKADTVVTKAFI